MKICSNISSILDTSFGVRHRSILATFNLFVVDIKIILDGGECIQYTQDFTIFCSCKMKRLCKCSNIKEKNQLNLQPGQ